MAKPAKPLELGARHAEVVQSAIQHWATTTTIPQDQASLLADTIKVRHFDWDKFAKYTLRLAVLFLIVAVSSVVFEERFIRFYRRLVALPAWLRALATAAMAVGVHIFAHQRSKRLPARKYTNEAIHALGALMFALAALQVLEQLKDSFERAVQSDGGEASKSKAEDDTEVRKRRRQLMNNAMQCVSFCLAMVYAAVGVLSQSNFIWSCSMMVLGYCCGGMADYMYGMYSISMDSPFFFIGFGSCLIGAARLMRSYAITAQLWSTTRTWGMLYLFVSLWILSIFGYDSYFERSGRRRAISPRIRMFLWSVIFFIAAGTSTWHGLRYDDSTTKGFGLTFIGINLYTKFFECFWGWSKPIFFAVLAGTFAVVGRYAENVWNMRVVAV